METEEGGDVANKDQLVMDSSLAQESTVKCGTDGKSIFLLMWHNTPIYT